MTIFPSEIQRPNFLKAFGGFLVVAAIAAIPAAEEQLVKQNMSATLIDRLLLYVALGAGISSIATFFYWWHRGSRRGLITALIIIAAFAFFGWKGAAN
jgi:hypothetical protein